MKILITAPNVFTGDTFNNSSYYVNINAEDIPGLIKALRDFFE